MIALIICSGIITAFAVVLCMFSGQQLRQEDEYFANQQKNATAEELEKAKLEQDDWDLLNHWDDD